MINGAFIGIFIIISTQDKEKRRFGQIFVGVKLNENRLTKSSPPTRVGGRVGGSWLVQQQLCTANFAIYFYSRRLESDGPGGSRDTNESRLEEASETNTHAAAGTRREGMASRGHYGGVRA